jgi:hypothetical protein
MIGNKLINEGVEIKLQAATNPLLIDLAEAIEQKRFMESSFNNADPQFIDVAIYQYNAAQERINVLIKQMKEEGVNYGNIINL